MWWHSGNKWNFLPFVLLCPRFESSGRRECNFFPAPILFRKKETLTPLSFHPSLTYCHAAQHLAQSLLCRAPSSPWSFPSFTPVFGLCLVWFLLLILAFFFFFLPKPLSHCSQGIEWRSSSFRAPSLPQPFPSFTPIFWVLFGLFSGFFL